MKNKLKKSYTLQSAFALIAAAMFLISAAVFASAQADDASAKQEIEISAGVTPDSPLHFFENLFDNIGLAFTFDKEKKADKALGIARERVMEFREMLNQDKPKAAETARAEHEDALSVVEDSIKGISDDNSELKLEKTIWIENLLEDHQALIEGLKVKLEAKHQNEISMLENSIVKARLEIEKEKDNSKIKIKAEGKSDKEINDIISRIEAKVKISNGKFRIEAKSREGNETKESKEELRIKANVFGNSSEIRVETKFSVSMAERDAILNSLLSKLRLSKEMINSTLKIENEQENREQRMKTEIKVENGIAEVKFDLRFPLNATERNAIVNGVSEKLSSLTVDKLKLNLRFEEKDRKNKTNESGRSGKSGSEDGNSGEDSEKGTSRSGSGKEDSDRSEDSNDDESKLSTSATAAATEAVQATNHASAAAQAAGVIITGGVSGPGYPTGPLNLVVPSTQLFLDKVGQVKNAGAEVKDRQYEVPLETIPPTLASIPITINGVANTANEVKVISNLKVKNGVGQHQGTIDVDIDVLPASGHLTLQYSGTANVVGSAISSSGTFKTAKTTGIFAVLVAEGTYMMTITESGSTAGSPAVVTISTTSQ